MQIAQQENKVKDERQSAVEEARRKVDIIRQQAQEERKQRSKIKEYLKRDTDNYLKLTEKQKEYEKEMADSYKKEWQSLSQENVHKELEKERKYKQFFSDYDKLAEARAKDYSTFVNNEKRQNKIKSEEWIQANQSNYKSKSKELEEYIKNWRKNVRFHELTQTF